MAEKKVLRLEPDSLPEAFDAKAGLNGLLQSMTGLLRFGGRVDVELGGKEINETTQSEEARHEYVREEYGPDGQVVARETHTVIYPQATHDRQEIHQPSYLAQEHPTLIAESVQQEPGWGETYIYKSTSLFKRLLGHGGLELPDDIENKVGCDHVRRGLFSGERVAQIVNPTSTERIRLQNSKGIEIINPSEFRIRDAELSYR